MTFDWQDTIVLAIVLVAATYVARIVWRSARPSGAGGCGGCAKCASNAHPAVVEITTARDELPQREQAR